MVKDPTCDDADRQKIEQVESLPFILTSSEVGMRDLDNENDIFYGPSSK